MIITVTLNPALDKTYWVEKLKIGERTQEEYVTRALGSHTSAGGKGVNVSTFLARMGIENVAMGFIAGHIGQVVIRDLRQEGVTTNFVWTQGETRTNITILEQGREHIPIQLNGVGVSPSDSEINRFMRRYRRVVKLAEWVILAGRLPPDTDDTLYYELTKIARHAGAKVVVSAGGPPLGNCLSAAPNIVKPDVRTKLSCLGKDLATVESIRSAGAEILKNGIEMVIISHDVTGDIVMTPDNAWEIKARVKTTEFKNLHGADDALVGGIVCKLHCGKEIEEALRFGMAAGILSAESDRKICTDMEKINDEMEYITLERI